MTGSNNSCESDFYTWLSKKIPESQLSILYLALSDISKFCINRHILKSPLYETDDLKILKKVYKTISSNKIFAFMHKKSKRQMITAIQYYLEYVEEMKLCPIDFTDTTHNSEGPTDSVAETKQPPREDKEDDDKLLTILDDADSIYLDNRDKGGCLWVVGGSEVRPLIEKCKELGVTFHFKPNGAHAIGGKAGWWTTDIVNSVPLSETSIEKIEVSTERKQDKNEDKDNRRKFITWLMKRDLSNKTIMSNLSLLNKCGGYAKSSKLLCDEDIFSITSSDEFKEIYDSLISDSWFRVMDQWHNNKYTVIMKLFYSYLKECNAGDAHINLDINQGNCEADKITNGALDCNSISSNVKNEAEATENDSPDSCVEPLLIDRKSAEFEQVTLDNVLYESKSESLKSESQKNQKKLCTPDFYEEEETDEVQELLHDDLFAPLRNALYGQNIKTIEQLRAIKLWAFMNQFNLYTIATRQTVLVAIHELLNPSNASGNMFELHVGESVFLGQTAAEAYLHFCEAMAIKYPLKIRSLMGKQIELNGPIAINRFDDFMDSLKMENPTAYINAELTSAEVLSAAKWIGIMCGEDPAAVAHITLMEPECSNVDNRPKEPDDGKLDGLRLESAERAPEEDKPANDNSISDIEHFVLDADMDGVSISDIRDEFDITMSVAKSRVAKCNHIVDIKGKLIHEDAFIDWEDGAESIASITERLMERNAGYISAAQLYEFARTEMNMFLNDNDMNDERAVYEMAQHLFEKNAYQGKQYTFTGKAHISASADTIESNFDVFCKFADDQGGVFSYNDLVSYLESVGIRNNSLRVQMKVNKEPTFLCYEEGMLIYSKYMGIDNEWKGEISHALTNLFADVGDHIILRDIQPIWFELLPDLPGGYKWTPLLLQSVLKFYGEELGARTIMAMSSQSNETVHTMLVQNDSPIQNFGDAVVSYLIDNAIEQRAFDGEELRALLVESNMIQGNELIYNMSKALSGDERFAWDASGNNVTIRV